MDIVVTGAGGYIGKHVVNKLASLGHRVRGYCRGSVPTELFHSDVELVMEDVLTPSFTFKETEIPELVIHLAWSDGFNHNSPKHMSLISAHFDFLLKCAGLGVNHLTVLGTMHEIGYWEGEITATTPTNPSTLYGIAKDALRKSLFISTPETTGLSWLRAFYITGDDRRNNSVFTKILEAEDRGDVTFPLTSGLNLYDFLDVEELVDQLIEDSMGFSEPRKRIKNLSSGAPVTLKSKVESFITHNSLEIEPIFGVFPDRPYDSPGVWGARS